jgi:hypothetical protein
MSIMKQAWWVVAERSLEEEPRGLGIFKTK